MEIRESQIEDILVNAPILVKKILNLTDEPRLIGRQIMVPSGRLDILYSYKTDFLLIELKAVPFHKKFVNQLINYTKDVRNIQNNGNLLKADIRPYLLCTHVSERDINFSSQQGICSLNYNPEDILEYFYNNLKPIASFIGIKPIDIGIWNLHLINKFIYELVKINSVNELNNKVGGSKKTLYNKIKFANELKLVEWNPNKDFIGLSSLGIEYIEAKDKYFKESLSDKQAELLRKFVIKNPYESSVILGIASIVESVFILSRNLYPVPINQLINYFTYSAGKIFDWKTEKARYNGTRMYSNYAADLGLIAKTENNIYLTPEGVKFTLKMQLHKSLKLVDSIPLN
jgi:hypothetical protein